MIMGTKDIWYGVLEAGDKTSPVVRDMSLEVSDTKRVWLYNHVKNQFVEYSLEIVEPKLRNLGNGDISLDELDQAFKSARKAFGLARKIRKWDNKTSTATVAQVDNDEPDIDLEDGDIEDYIDDD